MPQIGVSALQALDYSTVLGRGIHCPGICEC